MEAHTAAPQKGSAVSLSTDPERWAKNIVRTAIEVGWAKPGPRSRSMRSFEFEEGGCALGALDACKPEPLFDDCWEINFVVYQAMHNATKPGASWNSVLKWAGVKATP